MTEAEITVLTLTARLISFAIILQTIELLQIRRTLSDDGVWRWESLRSEFKIFPPIVQLLLNATLQYPNVCFVLALRLLAAVITLFIPHALPLTWLLLSTFLILLRFRGTFNGGSDYMTLIILAALTVAFCFPNSPMVHLGCLWYITLQLCLSYFVSGVVKLRRANWRSGKALAAFIRSSNYASLFFLTKLINNKPLMLIVSLSAIAFEIFFPLALFNPSLCLLFISGGLLFHLTNFYVFGLNRFVFAWASAYPALYYCSSGLQ